MCCVIFDLVIFDFPGINDELLKIQAIDKTLHEKFHKKYLQ